MTSLSERARLVEELDGARETIAGLEARLLELRRAEEELRVHHDLALRLIGSSSLEEVLGGLLEEVLQLEAVGADCGGVYVVRRDGTVELMVHRGLSPEFVEQVRRFPSDSPQARLVRAGVPVYRRYERLLSEDEPDAGLAEGLRGIGVIPVSCAGRVVACVNISSRTLDELPLESRSLIEGIAAQVGGAIARAAAEERRRVAEEERRRLEAQVLEAQKLESLGLMASGVAHDFNNLLVGILLNADLAQRRTPPGSPVAELLVSLQDGARRAVELTDQLLTFAGRGTELVESVDLSELVAGMRTLLLSSVPKRVKLELELADDLPGVEGDAAKLRQVVLNLVLNGAEAIEAGPGRVRVTTRGVDASALATAPSGPRLPERCVALEVVDSGRGLDARTEERICEPFFTTKATGRGLGLAVVQGITRAHRGVLRFGAGPEGQGAAFSVVLPASAGRAVSAGQAPPVADEWRGQGLVLLVDDEPGVRDATRRALAFFGLRVVTAEDGLEAVETFRRRHDEVSCILLDLSMPELGGVEALGELRRIRADVPVILTSGCDEGVLASCAADAGSIRFLRKPFELDALLQVLREVIES